MYHGNPKERTAWAVEQLKYAAKASKNMGLTAHVTFSGALLWHTVYPWPQRPAGVVEDGFKELAKRWLPILNAFDKAGVDLCYEIHPGEDLHDGATFERFWEATGKHSRCNILYDPSHFVLQQLDYFNTSTSIISSLRCSMLRMRNLILLEEAEYMADIRIG